MVKRKHIKIAISWSGIPVYAAKLMKAGLENNDNLISLIGTNLQVPVEITQKITKEKIHVVDAGRKIKWSDLGLEIPDIYFQAGWFIRSFNHLGKQVKKNGGKVIVLVDNCWKNNLRQYLGYIKFSLLYRNKFDGVWVPGKSGQKFVKFLGFRRNQIFTGLYGSDPNTFFSEEAIFRREKRFIFVGQLIPRKGIKALSIAFGKFHQKFPEWRLKVYGDGELEEMVDNSNGVDFVKFSSPQEIAAALRSSRFLILPSLVDHWPLVVSESALSGCGLILSDKVGNSYEFLTNKNGYSFKSNSPEDLYEKLCLAASLSQKSLIEAQNISLELGSRFLPKHWKIKFNKIINQLSK
ncbi:glycosyltransferase [bacterium]|nr:glycosyltransferase [bacterium]